MQLYDFCCIFAVATRIQSSPAMTPTTLFRRYIWLIDIIYQAGYITREEIDRKWSNCSYNYDHERSIPERTFHRHKEAILELFDIEIKCSKSHGNAYYIANADDMKMGGVRQWLVNTFAVNNLINESHHLKRRILFEHIPSGQRFLTPLIEAMRDEVTVRITYQGYHDPEPYTAEVRPYCVKIFKQRWYLLAYRPDKRGIRIYALDRMQEVTATKTKFQLPADFDADEYFAHFYGVYTDPLDGPELVRVKVSSWQAQYLRSLPLHHSQTEVEIVQESALGKQDGYSVFEYFIVPTEDFLQELRTHGHQLEVLSPEWVRDEMKWEAEEMVKAYKKTCKEH